MIEFIDLQDTGTLETAIKVEIPSYLLPDRIQDVSSINNIPIDEIEKKMRPGQSSQSGFIGENETLLELLEVDNNNIHAAGFTHEQIVYPIFLAKKAILDRNEFYYNRQRFSVSCISYGSKQYSPFGDNTSTRIDITITKQQDQTALTFSGLAPEMAARYSFYGGKNQRYRLPWEKVVSMFNLTPQTAS